MKPMSPKLLAVVLATAALTACAQDAQEINRVQPNVTKKSDLLGREWYLRTTTVGTQFTSASTFPGEMGSLVRGVFEVQEKALFFYKTYEFLMGSKAYTLKADIDTPVKRDGKVVLHAVPQDYQKIACDPKGKPDASGHAAECNAAADTRCANAWRADKWPEEEDHHGFCVQLATQYVFRGAPVLAFPISSHFDITYGYSTATGEKSNVKSENASDRKWYDRDYIRVSWGAQQLMNFDGDVLGGVLAGATAAPVIYEGENAPEGDEFESGEDDRFGEVKQKYFTYTHRLVASAPTTYLNGFGEIPICFFYPWYIGGIYDCTSEELKVRTFFLEVPTFSGKNADMAYTPREQDDVEFEKFGFFRTERPVYDIQFGTTFDNAVRRAQRHRVWDRYVKCYVDAKAPANSTECKPQGESTVWKGAFDYSKMTPMPIVYYMNADHPRELVQASLDIGKGFNEPFTDIVKHHKKEAPKHAMFIVCENSDAVALAAKKAGQVIGEYSGSGTPNAKFCRRMNEPHLFGDLRWSTMHAVPQPIQVGLYGYGPSAADPLTGEVLSGTAHSYVAAMKQGAEAALQALELQAGIKDFNDIRRAYEKTFKMNAVSVKTMGQKGPKSLEEARAAVAGMMDPEVREQIQGEGLPVVDNGGTWAQSRMARLQKAPALDAMLVSGDDGHSVHSLFRDPRVAKDKASTVDATQLKKMSLANWAHTAGLKARQKVYDKLAEKTLHFAEFADNALVGLAEKYGVVFDTEICKAYATAPEATLFNNFNDITTAAESCKTVGEFESKGMAKGRLCVKVGGENRWASCSTRQLMNDLRRALLVANGGNVAQADHYKSLPGPLYTDTMDPLLAATQRIGRDVVEKLRGEVKLKLWQEIYRGTQEHEVGHTVGLRHNFEASTDALNYHPDFWKLKLNAKSEVINPFQPDTLEQARGINARGIREMQLASVMDYTSKFNGRFGSLGLYDKAAIKFAYGDLVEVFKKAPDLTKSPGGDLAPMQDYLKTPSDDKPSVTIVAHHGNSAMNILTRRLHYSTLPAYFGSVDNMYARSNVSWQEIKGNRCVADAECGAGKCVAFGENSHCTNAAVTEVPYRFCSDEFNGQTASCATFDEGADPYEIARNALDDYEQYWFFWGYSRDSEMYHTNNYAGRVERQFYSAVKQFQFWAVDFATYQKNGWWKKRYGRDYDQDVNGGLSGGLATMNTFNTLAQVLARPTNGNYVYNPKRERMQPYDQVEGQNIDLHYFHEVDGARPMYGGWGGGYNYKPVSAGQIYDRMAAFQLLSDPTLPRFIATNESEDARRYLVSFFNFFPRELTNLFAGWSVEQSKYFGWYLLQGKTDKEDYMMRRVWVGPEADNVPKACSTYPAGTPTEQREGCLKYVLHPDGRPQFPSTRFRMPLLASYYGMSLLQMGGKRSYMDVSRVFLKGNQAAIDLPVGTKTVEFTDPLSGKTYVAAETAIDNDPKKPDENLDPGVMAVEFAAKELKNFPDLKSLQDNYLFSEYQFRVSLLDLVRTMHSTYEY